MPFKWGLLFFYLEGLGGVEKLKKQEDSGSFHPILFFLLLSERTL